MVGYQQQVLAACLLRDREQRIHLPLSCLYAVNGICDLDELDYLPVPYATKVDIARPILRNSPRIQSGERDPGKASSGWLG